MEYKIQVRDLERNKRNQKEEEKLRNKKKAYTALRVTLAIYYFAAKNFTSAIYT